MTTAPPGSTAPHGPRPAPAWAHGVLLIVEHYWTWYRRNWRATAISAVVQPLLFLLAFGIGFGSLLADRPDAAAATGGVGYLVWISSAILATAAVQGAVFESTYPVLSGFKWQRVFHAMTAGPITPAQVAVAHVTWVAIKTALTSSVFLLIILGFGGVTGPGILLALLASVLAAAAVAAAVTAYSATVQSEGGSFNVLFRFVPIPMTLVSGTFFPLEALPVVVRPVAWVLPLWHVVELSRMAALDRWVLGPALGHLAYLLAMLVVGLLLAARFYTRRLSR